MFSPSDGILDLYSNNNTELRVNGGNVAVASLAAGTSNSLCYNTSAIAGMNTLSTCSSDERLKQRITPLDASTTLSQVMQLDPVSFYWNNQFAANQPEQFGLIAQEVQRIWPNLVSTTTPTALTPGGTYSINFNGLWGPALAAIQEIMKIGGAFRDNLIAWLGDAGNGINDFFAKNIYSNNVYVQNELCLTEGANDPTPVCITKSQLATLLRQAGQGSGTTPPAGQGSAPAAPAMPASDASLTPAAASSTPDATSSSTPAATTATTSPAATPTSGTSATSTSDQATPTDAPTDQSASPTTAPTPADAATADTSAPAPASAPVSSTSPTDTTTP